MIRVVSILGKDDCIEVGHRFIPGGPPVATTRYSATAAAVDARLRFPGGQVSMVVLATQEAAKEHLRDLEIDLRRQLGRMQPAPHVVPISDGSDFAQQQEFFDKLHGVLSAGPVPGTAEQEAPREIVLDITHGFRALAVLAGAVASFARSEWRRLLIEDPPALRVLYAAPPIPAARPEDVIDVWDLSDFLVLAEWNSALDALRRFGRADDLDLLCRTDGAPRQSLSPEEKARFEYSKDVGSIARAFADDLALTRWQHLGKVSARAFRAHLTDPSSGRNAFVARRPVLDRVLRETASMAEGLDADALLDSHGLGLTLKLAKLYDRLQRYSELAVALRESATTGFAIEQNMLRIEPGQTGCSAARKEADKALQDDAKPRGAGTTSSARFSSSISNPRNQIEHGGIQDEVLTAGSLKNQLSRCIKRLEDMIEQIAAAAGSC